MDCGWNELKSLDLRGCTALTDLDCGWNELKSLDLSKNTALRILSIEGEGPYYEPVSLDLSNNIVLTKLSCSCNQLKKLDFGNNIDLEKKAELLGGQKMMYEYLKTNIKYPEEAEKNGIKGKVLVAFTVYENGEIRDVKVVKGSHYLLDNEALRVVRAMPNWCRPIQKGKVVNKEYTIPIKF